MIPASKLQTVILRFLFLVVTILCSHLVAAEDDWKPAWSYRAIYQPGEVYVIGLATMTRLAFNAIDPKEYLQTSTPMMSDGEILLAHHSLPGPSEGAVDLVKGGPRRFNVSIEGGIDREVLESVNGVPTRDHVPFRTIVSFSDGTVTTALRHRRKRGPFRLLGNTITRQYFLPGHMLTLVAYAENEEQALFKCLFIHSSLTRPQALKFIESIGVEDYDADRRLSETFFYKGP